MNLMIGICDDCFDDRMQIEHICNSTLQMCSVDFRIKQFQSGEELIKFHSDVNILILDIEMPGMSGLEVKNYLQTFDTHTMIIYVTSHDELMHDAFGLNVFGFVSKEKMEIQLPVMLKSAANFLKKTVEIEGINSDEIIFIKAEHIYSNLVRSNGTYHLVRMSLNKLEEKLSAAGFIRVHRAYLVNPKWIKKFEQNHVILVQPDIHKKKSDTKVPEALPVSQRMYTKAKKLYKTYFRENSRYC